MGAKLTDEKPELENNILPSAWIGIRSIFCSMVIWCNEDYRKADVSRLIREFRNKCPTLIWSLMLNNCFETEFFKKAGNRLLRSFVVTMNNKNLVGLR